MRTIFTGEQISHSQETIASLCKAIKQAEISLGNFLSSINRTIEAVSEKETRMTPEAIRVFEYQIMTMIQKLNEFQKILIQKKKLLSYTYQLELESEFDQHIKVIVERTLTLLNSRNFRNEFCKNRIYSFLDALVECESEDKLKAKNEEQQVLEQLPLQQPHRAKSPWISKGIYSKYKKGYR